ncbi:hypothetical protein [Pseudonocardia spinosispora]|uniref:hypothetical protein n=1 Tax=Pseudonocardia spinosispora TaxID=103441 RepID=UPI00041FA152|nr:hypothetical protein [Pseudonocardia spinosispora]
MTPNKAAHDATVPATEATLASRRARLVAVALLVGAMTVGVSGCAQEGSQYLGRWEHRGTMFNGDNSSALDITRDGETWLVTVYDPPTSTEPAKRMAADYVDGHLTVAGPPAATITYLESEDAILAGAATFTRVAN